MIKVVTDTNGNRHEIQLDDDLAFLAPYLTVAKRVGVPVWRVSHIKGYAVPSDKIERQYAATIRDVDIPNKKLVITILKRRQTDQRVSGYEAANESSGFEDTLSVFAHELSHVVHWDHGIDRFILEKKIQLAFAHKARKRGYNGY